MPERKNVMAALWSLASCRNRLNRRSSSSPAPSQENTTNCGGFWPGSSGSGVGWLGCGPVSEVEPSPIRVAGGLGTAALPFEVRPSAWAGGAAPPLPEVLAQPAARVAAVAAPAASSDLRERASMSHIRSPGSKGKAPAGGAVHQMK